MKLVTFSVDGGAPKLGVLDAKDQVRDLGAADASLPADMLGLIAGGEAALNKAFHAAAAAPVAPGAKVLAPIPRPRRNIFCVGKNYRAHVTEIAKAGFDTSRKDEVPEHPVIFTKPPSAVIGPGVAIQSSYDPMGTCDYEGELAVVIGKAGRRISATDAMAYIFGYTILNDVTSRGMQKRHQQWALGKGIDTFCPLGPAIVVADTVGDPSHLTLCTYVNGEERQRASVSDLIFDVPTLIATISSVIALEPGDIIATGTPSGVGVALSPPQFLKAGDTVRIEIPGVGCLENPVA